MRIVLAGASGFLGTRLAQRLTADGDVVVRLVRRAASGPGEYRWDPGSGLLDPEVLDGSDAVVNLCGAAVARLWTSHGRRLIRHSRVEPTTVLARAVASAKNPPAALLNASAVGFYGSQGDRVLDERSPAGEDFLAGVCRVWEAATRPAEDAGVRVAHLRTGLVLGHGGGLLGPLVPVFRAGLGGRLGGGRQYLPWIALADWLSATRTVLDSPTLAGPVNLVGPEPVTNEEFTRALGEVLGRPTLVRVPGPALRVALGGFSAELLNSRRVVPAVLRETGFEFRFPDIRGALRAALT